MTEKTEALRLADRLESDLIRSQTMLDAAAELRRLHEENEALGLHLSERMKDLARVEAQRDEMLEALKGMLLHMGMDEDEWNRPTFDFARAAIAKAEEA